jgi:hypothetical protein
LKGRTGNPIDPVTSGLIASAYSPAVLDWKKASHALKLYAEPRHPPPANLAKAALASALRSIRSRFAFSARNLLTALRCSGLAVPLRVCRMTRDCFAPDASAIASSIRAIPASSRRLRFSNTVALPRQKAPMRSMKNRRAALSVKCLSTAILIWSNVAGPRRSLRNADRRGPLRSKSFPAAMASCSVRNCLAIRLARFASSVNDRD